MRQVEINALDIVISSSDQVNGNSQTTTNINQLPELLKTFVRLKDLLDDNSSVVEHCCVKHLIKSGVQVWILEDMRAISSIEWNSSLKNCIVQLGPMKSFGQIPYLSFIQIQGRYTITIAYLIFENQIGELGMVLSWYWTTYAELPNLMR